MDHVLNWICQGVAVAAATSGALRLLDRSRAQARYVLLWDRAVRCRGTADGAVRLDLVVIPSGDR